MSDTIPLVNLPTPGEWVDVNDVTGIAVGTPMTFKVYSSQTHIDLAISTLVPASNFKGFPINSRENTTFVDTGENRIWARSDSVSRLSVQEG